MPPPPSKKPAPRPQRRSKKRFNDRDRKSTNGPVLDYKELELLRKFVTGHGRLISRKRAGTSAMEQRDIALAVKRARFMALLPYVGT